MEVLFAMGKIEIKALRRVEPAAEGKGWPLYRSATLATRLTAGGRSSRIRSQPVPFRSRDSPRKDTVQGAAPGYTALEAKVSG